MRVYIISLIITFVSISFYSKGQEKLKNITLEEIWSQYRFFPKSVRGIRSLNNGKHYTRIKDGNILVYDYKSGDSVRTLLQGDQLKPEGQEEGIKINDFSLSKDEKKVLIPSETESIYRHSSKSTYYIWDIGNQQLDQLSVGTKQQLADFSPEGNKVAFLQDNNLFVKDLTNKEITQLTTDGAFNKIINGSCDWVYEEEFSFTKAFFWSPDGRYIAFYRFDESAVKEYTLTFYDALYPELYTYKYPKAGEDNSVVSILVYDLETGATVKMDVGDEADQYIPRIKWTNSPGRLAIQRLNRLQNELEILLSDAQSGQSRVIYTELNHYYVDITDDLNFLPDEEGFIISSEKSGYNHIYFYNMEGELVKQLTDGNWDVIKVYGYDAAKKQVYYQSAEFSPLNQEIARVNLKGVRTTLSEKVGVNRADFSSNFKYYINTYSEANTPPFVTVNANNGKEIRILEDNNALIERLNGYNLSKKEFFSFTSPAILLPDSQQVHLNGWRIFPPDFDPEKKYPVLLTVYGGPGSQTVQNSWGGPNDMWYQMLAEQGIIVVSVDNRGTGSRGEIFKKMTYLELGKYETLDYIETAKYLGNLPYVDAERIGIFGWSYGGFMASNALFQGADYFSTAIAVAPVTNWRYYDNIYTERYMRKPIENVSGYDNNSPINHVDKLKGNFLLIHGSTDDNVHFQNTMDLATALAEANKQFELMVYPNKNHGIYGGNTRFHLFDKMTRFIYEYLKPSTQ